MLLGDHIDLRVDQSHQEHGLCRIMASGCICSFILADALWQRLPTSLLQMLQDTSLLEDRVEAHENKIEELFCIDLVASLGRKAIMHDVALFRMRIKA